MRFHIITIFPEMFDSYLKESIIGRAIKNKKISIKFYNPRDFIKAPKNNYRGRGNYNRSESSSRPTTTVAKPMEVKAAPVSASSNPLKIILAGELSPAETELLKSKMNNYPGGDAVYFKVNNNGKDQIIKSGFLINNCAELKNELAASLDDKIKIVSV